MSNNVSLLDMLLAVAALGFLAFSLLPWKDTQGNSGVTFPKSACYLGVMYFTKDGVPTTPVLDYQAMSPMKCERLSLERAK